MVDQVAQLLGFIGFDSTGPANMQELIPYLLNAGIAVGLLVACLKLFRFMISLIFGKPRM